MKAMTKEQLDAVLAVAKKHSDDDYLALLIGFNHGLRISEILSLCADNIVSGFLVVQRLKGSRKTVQPLLPTEAAAIADRVAKGGRFFSVCRKTFWLHMKRYCAEAGIPFGRDFVTPHSLKHTTGRLGYIGGMGVAELQTYLGHVNGANTMVYMAAPEDEAAKAFAAAVGA